MGRPRKNKEHTYGSLLSDWKEGKIQKFRDGQLVETKSGSIIGLIYYATHELKKYRLRVWKGPNPWDELEGTFREDDLVLSTKPNPFTYKWSDRVPGPSSTMIDELNEKYRQANLEKQKTKTSKDVDLYTEVLEEELVKKKTIEKELNESYVDSIVDATLDEEPINIVVGKNDLDAKIDKILDEE